MANGMRHFLGRFAFVGMILLVLGGAMLAAPAAAETCAAVGEVSAVADNNRTDSGAAGECGKCALSCAHGCCHAPVLGVLSSPPMALQPLHFAAPSGWDNSLGIPLADQPDVLRPPRP